MYRIRNKLESINLINRLNLNVLPQKLIDVKNGEDIIEFLDNNPAEFYFLRDSLEFNSKRMISSTRSEIINGYKNFDICTVGISQKNYLENLLFVGSIIVYSNGNITIEGRNDGKYVSVREAVDNANYRINTDMFDKRLKYIKGIDQIINYVLANKLQDILVEFSSFDIKLGINNENVLIWELRTDY